MINTTPTQTLSSPELDGGEWALYLCYAQDDILRRAHRFGETVGETTKVANAGVRLGRDTKSFRRN